MGQGLDVTVFFRAYGDTGGQETINKATVQGAKVDPDGDGGLPPQPLATQEAQAGVVISIPTGLTLASLTAQAAGKDVRLAWETATEREVVGFNVLRRAGMEEALVAVNDELILAEHPGASQGAGYALDDRNLAAGAYTYVLELVKLDGTTEQAGSVPVVVGG